MTERRKELRTLLSIPRIMDDFIDVDTFLEDKRKETYGHIHAPADPCNISILVTLYIRAANILYVDHMDGFKTLVHWLGRPIPSSIEYLKLPDCLGNYTIQELAKHMGVTQEEVFYTMLKIEGIKE